MEDLKISLIQSDIYWEQAEANLAMFEEKIRSIENADLIVLPEMFTTGFSMIPDNLSEPPGGRTFKWLRQMAKHTNAAITGSYIVKDGGNYFNRLYFVLPDGSSSYYDKKHLFTLAGEQEHYTSGENRLILEYKGWKICPMICYDLRFPVWSRSRSTDENLYEYDLLIYVASWPEPRINAWDTLLKARAIENLSYCVGVNRTGTDPTPKNYPGHSAIYSYKGETIRFSEEEAIIESDLSYAELQDFREQFPFQKDADPLT